MAANGAEGKHEPLSLRKLAARAAARPAGRSRAAPRSPRAARGPASRRTSVDVEVDRETGAVKVLRYTAVQDAGKAVHPSYVEGQMQGGAVQGIGWALNEEYVFDAKGGMQNAGFLDYRMPVASRLADDRHGDRRGAESRRTRTACAAWARRRSCRRSRPSPTPCSAPRACEIRELPISPPQLLELIEAAR